MKTTTFKDKVVEYVWRIDFTTGGADFRDDEGNRWTLRRTPDCEQTEIMVWCETPKRIFYKAWVYPSHEEHTLLQHKKSGWSIQVY